MKSPAKTGSPPNPAALSDRQQARAARLAAELRANLKRRKAAARDRDAETQAAKAGFSVKEGSLDDGPADTGGDAGPDSST